MSEENTKKRSVDIDGLRTFLNTLIVLHHTGTPWMVVSVGAVEGVICSYLNKVTWTLPTLFCLSGYLMFIGYSQETIKHKFWSRCKRLAAPLLLVNWGFALIIGVGILFSLVHDPKYNLTWMIRSFFCVKAGTTLTTLWYVRTLLIFTIFSPVIYWLIRRKAGQILLLLLAIGWCIVSSAIGIDGQLAKVIPSFSVLAFSIGAVLAIRGVNICAFARKWWLPVVVVYLISVSLRAFYQWPCENGINQAVQCLFWFVFATSLGKLMKNRFYRYLCESAFFVFAIHSNMAYVFALRVLRAIYNAVPQTCLAWPGEFICATLLVFILNLAFCLLLYAVGKKVCPLLTRIMN